MTFVASASADGNVKISNVWKLAKPIDVSLEVVIFLSRLPVHVD